MNRVDRGACPPDPAQPVLPQPAQRATAHRGLAVVTAAAVLPATPRAGDLGFAPVPDRFIFVLVLMVIGYLVLVKHWFFRTLPAAPARRPRARGYRTRRRPARFSSGARC